MAEQSQRDRQWTYAANSNLVLKAKRDGPIEADKYSGEVSTLNGKLDGFKMGDRSGVARANNTELDERIKNARLKRDLATFDSENTIKRRKGSKSSAKVSSVLNATEDLDTSIYRPKTRESKDAYEQLMAFIKSSIGVQPQDILHGAADEDFAGISRSML